MNEIKSTFPGPWRVEITQSKFRDTQDISIVTHDGYTVLVVAKHPVWSHMEEQRIALAKTIAGTMNRILFSEKINITPDITHTCCDYCLLCQSSESCPLYASRQQTYQKTIIKEKNNE